LPREQLDRVERMDELYGFLDQSNISKKNIARLEILTQHANGAVKDLALLILEVVRVKPHKWRRWKFLGKNHPALFERLKDLYGGDIPDADLSSLDFDPSSEDDIEFGKPGIPSEAANWEDDPYWLVDSED
jgi:hypothetical protein